MTHHNWQDAVKEFDDRVTRLESEISHLPDLFGQLHRFVAAGGDLAAMKSRIERTATRLFTLDTRWADAIAEVGRLAATESGGK